ncbi:SRPBCC domain-containing protein [Cytobacillus gottheilii]|uniref:SRPBCC domain-containing protein n=1 Tax=Cytobacillus gottheilii TaxID=859144 RepID=UPI00249454F2|nr:SRPBCC domain-containing protein [Cytobacillus gottheilii]
MTSQMKSKAEGNVLVLEREFNASKSVLFKAFSEEEHLKKWWGPRGWMLTLCDLDFKVNGVWHYCMKCVDEEQGEFFGFESWGKGVYQEIIEDEKIVYIDYFSDAEGNEAEGMPSTLCTLLFEEIDGKTKLVSTSEYASSEALNSVLEMGVEDGMKETWDRLEEYLDSIKK